jgi:hypothetical protein
MKLLFFIFFFFFIANEKSSAFIFDNIQLYGNTSYSKQKNEKLTTNLNTEYKFRIHEAKNKKYAIYISSNINPDYDHFGKEIKLNTFTSISISF